MCFQCVWLDWIIPNVITVVSSSSLYHLEELCLASCTDCFSTVYDACFDTKSLSNLSARYAPNPVHTRLLFLLLWAGWNLPTTNKRMEHSRRVSIEGHSLHFTGRVAQTAFVPIPCAVRKKRPLEVFRPLRAARLFFRLTWAGWIWPSTRKLWEHPRRVCVEGQALYNTGTIVAIAFSVNGLHILPSTRSWLLDKRPTRPWTSYD